MDTMASKEMLKSQPVVADVTKSQLFNDPYVREIASMIGNSATLKLLESVVKLDRQYRAGQIDLTAFNSTVFKILVDLMTVPATTPQQMAYDKTLEDYAQASISTPTITSFKTGVAGALRLLVKFTKLQFMCGDHSVNLRQVGHMVDLLEKRAFAQKYGLTREQGEKLEELLFNCRSYGLDALAGTVVALNAQLKTGAITRKAWKETIGSAIAESAPKWKDRISPLNLMRLHSILEKIRSPELEAEAVYTKVKKV